MASTTSEVSLSMRLSNELAVTIVVAGIAVALSGTLAAGAMVAIAVGLGVGACVAGILAIRISGRSSRP